MLNNTEDSVRMNKLVITKFKGYSKAKQSHQKRNQKPSRLKIAKQEGKLKKLKKQLKKAK